MLTIRPTQIAPRGDDTQVLEQRARAQNGDILNSNGVHLNLGFQKRCFGGLGVLHLFRKR